MSLRRNPPSTEKSSRANSLYRYFECAVPYSPDFPTYGEPCGEISEEVLNNARCRFPERAYPRADRFLPPSHLRPFPRACLNLKGIQQVRYDSRADDPYEPVEKPLRRFSLGFTFSAPPSFQLKHFYGHQGRRDCPPPIVHARPPLRSSFSALVIPYTSLGFRFRNSRSSHDRRCLLASRSLRFILYDPQRADGRRGPPLIVGNARTLTS